MLKKYTIIELVEQVNKKLKEMGDFYTFNSDNRQTELVTERKVRDLLTKNIISRGQKDGRVVYFDDLHVDQIIEVKKLQNQGMSSKLLMSYTQTSQNNENDVYINSESVLSDPLKSNRSPLQKDVLKELNEMIIGSASGVCLNGEVTRSLINTKSIDQSFLKETEKYRDLNKLSVKSYLEYPLDDTGGLILKMESNYKAKDKEEILKKIKQIIGD